MAQPTDPPPYAHVSRNLDAAWKQYLLLAGRVPPARAGGGTHVQPGSRPPLHVQMVDHMAALESYLDWWLAQARWMLQPVQKIELTRREGVRCPYCGADLIAWLYLEKPDRSEIVCTNPDPAHDGNRRWLQAEWKRLGVVAGVHLDERFGARPPWADSA